MTTPRKPLQLTPEKILKAMDGTHGIISRIADRLKVARSTIYEYLERYPELKVALQAEKDRVDDMLEETLFDEGLGGWKENPHKEGEMIYHPPNTAVLIFLGKTRLKHRGYSEKQELELSGNVDINHYATASDVFDSLISETTGQPSEATILDKTEPRREG